MDNDAIQAAMRDILKTELPAAIQEALKSTPPDTPAPATPAPAASSEPATPDGDGSAEVKKHATVEDMQALEKRLTDHIDRALAKGETETDPTAAQNEVTFL